MNCFSCRSKRIIEISGKCSDMFHASIDNEGYSGYVLDKLGIGGGDYIRFSYCLNCGQIQDDFPLPTTELERTITDQQVLDFFLNHFSEGALIKDDLSNRVFFRYIVESAERESPAFGRFMKDFFRFYEGKHYPSAVKFVEMFRKKSFE